MASKTFHSPTYSSNLISYHCTHTLHTVLDRPLSIPPKAPDSFLPRSSHMFVPSVYPLSLLVDCQARAFSSCGEQGLLFVAVRGLLIAVASLVAEHGL